ncbi:ArsR/SmtB family transcription factor [Mangrovicoccus ximenensis]|uniref:ArsR/SmtB family transcription factor n=1 Tax=Mangrovicoccus ximenensis TaxID=1911570 RepID=UPI000D359118|nr:metalloregulator ArsR/SmtB family transcription factor [Mangrovicoccus ximenensis]
MTYAAALQALADPTRRAIVEKLRHGPKSVGQLAQGFCISRPAVSQHLRVLCGAGLLDVVPVGARRVYRLLHRAAERFGLSARGFHRILRVARTIADLGGSADIRAPHMAEALSYRLTAGPA